MGDDLKHAALRSCTIKSVCVREREPTAQMKIFAHGD